jgi:DNA-binding NtrC family response regulator
VQVYPLHVPALRDRAEDIPRLVHHYLAVIAARE